MCAISGTDRRLRITSINIKNLSAPVWNFFFIEVNNITNELSPSVQMQFMRPGQLEAAARKFPVVYVPFGCIEWHGKHLPLGTDAIKAHGILVKTAEQFGGVVFLQGSEYFQHQLYV